ncbi:MAG: ATP-binding cassette domain-containing protein [Marinilabiliaceae bacterium]|nr:ATP-binding cassette domain-containing protein [Marinilabiliaceae bacterium]
MSISVTKVSHFYGKQQALKEVSFSLRGGEVVGFLGPNGAGKSTMMKILTGFLPQTSGEVFVAGENVLENNVSFRSKIGYLPEHNPLYSDLYVSEYLDFIASIYKIKNKRERIKEMIECVGLTPERQKKIGALSKGFRQRVGLAQALLPNPEVLILDEPTTGFDPNQISEVRTLIKNLGQSKTILLSTHIMQEVKAICERVIIIHSGSIVADEHPDALESLNLSGDTILEVEFDKPFILEKLFSIKGIKKLEKLTTERILVIVAAGLEVRPEIFKFAVDNNLVLMSLTKKHQSLEEVFYSLTN